MCYFKQYLKTMRCATGSNQYVMSLCHELEYMNIQVELCILFFQTLEVNAVVIIRGHIFPIPFRVKFIHLIPLKKCKNMDFITIEGADTAISEYPFNYVMSWGI